MSTEDPRGDWGEWTPGKGVERIRTEMPGVMPDLTEEDYAAAEAVIAAAVSDDDAGEPVGSAPTAEEPHWVFCSYCYSARQYNSRHCRIDGTCCEPDQLAEGGSHD